MPQKYESVIGLEVHCQLNTQTKLFCTDPYIYGEPANTQAGAVTLALPGALPVLNQMVLKRAIMTGLALDCEIAAVTKFDRKHYFYPDLPKGYQISQYDMPYATKGCLRFRRSNADAQEYDEGIVHIHRIHMEEDAGKLIHTNTSTHDTCSYVDLNRAGVPLLEIVTEPDIHSPQDAVDFLQTLRALLRAIEITDGNMEEGSLRCDANISLRSNAAAPLGTRVEIKNLNSFKAVRAAIEYQIQEQTELLQNGASVIQSTVLWDADKRETRLMRTKEDAEDYRYFPEPDLLPLHIASSLVAKIREQMPELPAQRRQRYMREFQLSEYDVDVLIREKEVAAYFENVQCICKDAKKAANWVKDEVLGVLNKEQIAIADFKCSAERLGRIILLLNQNKITSRMAKQIFEHVYKKDMEPEKVIEKYNYKPIDMASLNKIISEVFSENESNVQKILAGNERVKGHLIGQVMKKTRGQAPPQELNRLIQEKLDALSARTAR